MTRIKKGSLLQVINRKIAAANAADDLPEEADSAPHDKGWENVGITPGMGDYIFYHDADPETVSGILM